MRPPADPSNAVVIAGGGPAGCAAARLLALWGHEVHLLTRSRVPQTPVLAESLPPSCAKLFAVLDVERAIAEAGFVRSTGNTVWWGSGEGRVERFPDAQRGWQITRDVFASTLIESAREAGAVVEHGRVIAEQLDAAPAAVVLDCSGRSGVIARARGWRVYEDALKTVALAGVWRHPASWEIADPTHTLIESYEDGWLWSVPAASGVRYIAAMVDPRVSRLERSAKRDMYCAEIAKAPHFAALTREARLEAGPSGWDASMYWSTRYADDRVLLVGDAGSFIDPLSSAGVKKALASGWLAAVAAHTALVRPAMRQVAFEFFAAREHEVYTQLRQLTQRYLAQAAAAHAHPFWSDREFSELTPAEGIDAAFAQLRAAAEFRVRRGDVTFSDRAAVRGREILLERQLLHHTVPGGIRFLHDVDVVALVELAPLYSDVGDLVTAYTQRCGPVALPDFLRAIATALARGWLVWSIVPPC